MRYSAARVICGGLVAVLVSVVFLLPVVLKTTGSLRATAAPAVPLGGGGASRGVSCSNLAWVNPGRPSQLSHTDLGKIMPSTTYLSAAVAANEHAMLGEVGFFAPLAQRYVESMEVLDVVLQTNECFDCPTLREACRSCPRLHLEGCKWGFDFVMLNTYPNSGTTWTRQLFDDAAGYASENVYAEGVPTGYGTHRSTVQRARRSLEPAFVKSHSTAAHDARAARVVHLRRDLIDNVMARYRYNAKAHASTYIERAPYFDNVSLPLPPNILAEWKEFALKEAAYYLHWHCLSARAYRGRPMLFVRYEDMLQHPVEELTRLLEFVDVGVDTLKVMRAIAKSPPKHVQALRGVPAYLFQRPNFMTEEVVSAIVGLVGNITDAMKRDPAACEAPWDEWDATKRWEALGTPLGKTIL